MKKNLFYYLFAVICSVSLFTSCSDDDDEKVVCPVGETTFTEEFYKLKYCSTVVYMVPRA